MKEFFGIILNVKHLPDISVAKVSGRNLLAFLRKVHKFYLTAVCATATILFSSRF